MGQAGWVPVSGTLALGAESTGEVCADVGAKIQAAKSAAKHRKAMKSNIWFVLSLVGVARGVPPESCRMLELVGELTVLAAVEPERLLLLGDP